MPIMFKFGKNKITLYKVEWLNFQINKELQLRSQWLHKFIKVVQILNKKWKIT